MLPDMKPNIRRTYFGLFAFSLFLLAASFILQYGFHLQPCPLCIIARMVVIALAILFGIMLIHRPQKCGIQIYSVLGFILSFIGILITGRHMWIIHLPPSDMPSCSPGFNYLIETFPLKEVLMIILKSSGECAENNHVFMGLLLPEWTLLAFVALAIGCVFLWWQSRKET
jgi:disulfide bond formation protein DsbB